MVTAWVWSDAFRNVWQERKLAGEEEGFKIKTSIKVKPPDIGNLKTANEETVVGKNKKSM